MGRGARVALGLWCAFVVAVLVVLLVLGRFLTAAVAGGAGVLLTLLYAFTLSWMGKEVSAGAGAAGRLAPTRRRPPPDGPVDLDIETERLWDYGTHAWLFAVLLGVGIEAVITAAGVLPSVEKVPAGGGGVALGLVLVAAAVGILCFVDGAIEWRKRHAAVVADGWRPAEALVFTPGHRTDTSKVSIRFRDHSRILLYRRSSTHGSAAGRPRRPRRSGSAARGGSWSCSSRRTSPTRGPTPFRSWLMSLVSRASRAARFSREAAPAHNARRGRKR